MKVSNHNVSRYTIKAGKITEIRIIVTDIIQAIIRSRYAILKQDEQEQMASYLKKLKLNDLFKDILV